LFGEIIYIHTFFFFDIFLFKILIDNLSVFVRKYQFLYSRVSKVCRQSFESHHDLFFYLNVIKFFPSQIKVQNIDHEYQWTSDLLRIYIISWHFVINILSHKYIIIIKRLMIYLWIFVECPFLKEHLTRKKFDNDIKWKKRLRWFKGLAEFYNIGIQKQISRFNKSLNGGNYIEK